MTTIAKKQWIVWLTLTLISLTSSAQLSKFTMDIAPGIFIGYSEGASAGAGFELKASWRTSKTSQFTMNLGLVRMRTITQKVHDEYVHTSLIPFTLGYKKYWNKFYIEPKAGIGNMTGRFNIGGDRSKPNLLTVNYSTVAGLKFPSCYLEAELSSGAFGVEKDGVWNNRKFFYSGIKAGFRIFH